MRPLRRPGLPSHGVDAATADLPEALAGAAALPLDDPMPVEEAAVPQEPAAEPAAHLARAPRPDIPGGRPVHGPARRPMAGPAGWRPGPGPDGEPPREAGSEVERVATAPQLRRFIKSRAYVPMHELRRRFAINGNEDDVTPLDVDRNRVYVGLPEREGRLLGELLRGGDIGYELSLDPISPVVVGVYPMRPVTRG